jgi:hypothetical protein
MKSNQRTFMLKKLTNFNPNLAIFDQNFINFHLQFITNPNQTSPIPTNQLNPNHHSTRDSIHRNSSHLIISSIEVSENKLQIQLNLITYRASNAVPSSRFPSTKTTHFSVQTSITLIIPL